MDRKISIIILLTVIVSLFFWYGYYWSSHTRVELVTDKREYHINETITARIIIYNENNHPIRIKSITKYSSMGRSKSESNPTVVADVHITPAGEYLTIDGKSNIVPIVEHFHPDKIGEYLISIMGCTTTVNIIE